MKFSVEETNLIAIYMPDSKAGIIENIRKAISDVGDPDMLALMENTLAKLDGMHDADFDAHGFVAEDYIDETEE